MKPFEWDEEKNEWLLSERGVSFEMVVDEIAADRFRIEDNRSKEHPGQKVFVVGFQHPQPPPNTIVYVVPFSENDEKITLITMFDSPFFQKKYGEII